MNQRTLLGGIPSHVDRQQKTDRLILERMLREESKSFQLDLSEIERAHQILVRWADLESRGRLEKLNETQLQGDFLAEVFGEALGYARAVENAPAWHQEQHPPINGQTPDAILGEFRQDGLRRIKAVIELKGPKVHPDRDRSNGRTAVDQCWDYLVNLPTSCRWGIVSNLVSFRLYERNSTKRAYEHFTLRSLRDIDVFRRFYVLLHRKGLVEKTAGRDPLAVVLLEKTRDRQREVGDKLYDLYSQNRTALIEELHFKRKFSAEEAIEMAQRLLDRIIFIAFCEDRNLLPEKTIKSAYSVAGFHVVTNPRWQSFKNLFHAINVGSDRQNIEPFNGGLFASHAVDELDLPDAPWTEFFHSISGYDFADEVNLDVLGKLFERSISELEKIKETGLFGGNREKTRQFAQMPIAVKRKQLGIYYTPPELTSRIVQYTVDELIAERFASWAEAFDISADEALRGIFPDDVEYWRGCLNILRAMRILDPACGSGAFLFQAYNVLEHRYLEVLGHLDNGDGADEIPHWILEGNLYGVDLSPEAVEITQLALWIRSATLGQTLTKLSRNIVHGNSLVHDSEVHPAGFDWRERFPEVFERDEQGFDCVIGNPPWERIKLQEREFFSLPAPEIATATNAAKRRALVAKLESDDPALYGRYQEALEAADSLLTYCRRSDEYPLTGKGDINTYAVFAELASRLVAPLGRVGVLVPSGISCHHTTKAYFGSLAESNRLIRQFEFDNKHGNFFPDIHRDTQFVILNFGGEEISCDRPDFVFSMTDVKELEESSRHLTLTGDDIKLLNPNTRTCPIFRSRRDAEITKAIYKRVPVLIDRNRKGPTGNPWGIKFKRMFDQTNNAELFREVDELKKVGYQLDGNRWVKRKEVCLPLYEAKMFNIYDHRYGTVFEDTTNWINQGQTVETNRVQHTNPEFLVLPRYWAIDSDVNSRAKSAPAYLAFRDITNPTNRRTMLSTFIPSAGFINTAPILLFNEKISSTRQLCLQANFATFAFDYVARRKVHGRHMNFYLLEQLPAFAPDTYTKPTPWNPKQTLETWISERVLKLTCTAEDMLPLAEACDFKSGSFQSEYGGKLNKWDEAERAELMAELDAAYFHLYGISRDDAEYILSTFKGIHQRGSLFPDSRSVAEMVLEQYEAMG